MSRSGDKKCGCPMVDAEDTYTEAQHDARGIFLCFTCSECERRKLEGFRPDVLTDPNYWHDEPIESD